MDALRPAQAWFDITWPWRVFTCVMCHSEFLARYSLARFCSDACRRDARKPRKGRDVI